MKVCKKCNTQKELTEFRTRNYTTRPNNPYYTGACKQCEYEYKQKYNSIPEKRRLGNLRARNYRHKKKDGKWSVYMLTNAKEYVGYTNNEWRRMTEHRATGKDTTDYRVLMKCDTKEDAIELEELLHDMGYPGRHKKSPTKR